MNRVAFDFGVIQIYWYSIFILLAFFVAMGIITRESKRVGFIHEIADMLVNTALVGIVGARLYYVVFNFSYYKDNLLEIFEIWNGGLAIYGGIIFGIAYIFLYTRKRGIPFIKQLDVASLGLIIGQAVGRWGNFFNQEAYGRITTLEALEAKGLPEFLVNGMKIDGFYRQPAFLYESIWNLIGFLIMYVLRKQRYLKTGTLLAFYLAWYSAGRIVIEGLRGDSLMIGPFRVSQLVSIFGIILAVLIFIKNSKLAKLDNLYNSSTVKETSVKAKKEVERNSSKHKVQQFKQESIELNEETSKDSEKSDN